MIPGSRCAAAFSSSASDPHWAQVVALLPMSASPFTDVKGNAVGGSGTSLDGTRTLFGLSTCRMGGGGYLTVPSSTSSVMAFGTGDFTIEFWVLTPTSFAAAYMGDLDPEGTTERLSMYINNSGANYRIAMYTTSGETLGTTNLSTNTWYHVAYCRASGTLRMFLNGNQEGSIAHSVNMSTNRRLFLGASSSPGTYWAQNMAQARVTTYGRYTGGFTAPTGPFPQH